MGDDASCLLHDGVFLGCESRERIEAGEGGGERFDSDKLIQMCTPKGSLQHYSHFSSLLS
jgi:hypothetical protein